MWAGLRRDESEEVWLFQALVRAEQRWRASALKRRADAVRARAGAWQARVAAKWAKTNYRASGGRAEYRASALRGALVGG